jgi:hypothetical protein
MPIEAARIRQTVPKPRISRLRIRRLEIIVFIDPTPKLLVLCIQAGPSLRRSASPAIDVQGHARLTRNMPVGYLRNSLRNAALHTAV